jgi:hypothetical protein
MSDNNLNQGCMINYPTSSDPNVCTVRRQALEGGNPYKRFDLHFDFYYFSHFKTYVESRQLCNKLSCKHPTVEEIDALKSQIQSDLQGCSTLVWATENENPVIVLISPTGRNRILRWVSESCRANTICVKPLE